MVAPVACATNAHKRRNHQPVAPAGQVVGKAQVGAERPIIGLIRLTGKCWRLCEGPQIQRGRAAEIGLGTQRAGRDKH